jgi:hypothetical protein
MGTGAVRWKPCSGRAKRRWRPSPGGVGRDGIYARGQGGSGKAVSTSEPLRGSGETELVPEAKGSGELRFGPEIEETDALRPASWRWSMA